MQRRVSQALASQSTRGCLRVAQVRPRGSVAHTRASSQPFASRSSSCDITRAQPSFSSCSAAAPGDVGARHARCCVLRGNERMSAYGSMGRRYDNMSGLKHHFIGGDLRVTGGKQSSNTRHARASRNVHLRFPWSGADGTHPPCQTPKSPPGRCTVACAAVPAVPGDRASTPGSCPRSLPGRPATRSGVRRPRRLGSCRARALHALPALTRDECGRRRSEPLRLFAWHGTGEWGICSNAAPQPAGSSRRSSVCGIRQSTLTVPSPSAGDLADERAHSRD